MQPPDDASSASAPATTGPADDLAGLALAIEGSGTGLWDRNVVTGEIHYSRGWKRNLGYSDDEVSNRIEDSYGRVHPDDLAYVQQAMADHFAGKTEQYVVEHRIRCKNGNYLWISSRGKVISRDADGRALRMTGISTNISNVKALANQLQDSVDLITSLTDQVPGLLFQYRQNADGTASFPYTSAGLAEIYELAPADAAIVAPLGAGAVDVLLHAEDRGVYFDTLAASARELKQWQLEYRVVLPGQGLRWREGKARPRRLADGATVWHGLITDITERKCAEATLQDIAMLDFLTGLPNRRKFMACLGEERARLARQRDGAAAVLMLDLDHFKDINDRYGHARGDQVLCHFASILQTALRAVDVAGRIGGEEFAVLLHGSPPADALLVAQRIQSALAAQPCVLAAENGDDVAPLVFVTVSIGIATMAPDCLSVDAVLNQADAAMYRAKQTGRNRIVVASAL